MATEYPDFVPAGLLLGLTQGNLSQLDVALGTFESLQQKQISDRQRAWIQLQMGDIYQQMRRVDLALSSYELACAQEEYAGIACNNIAWLMAVDKKDPQGALPYVERSLKMLPENPAVADTAGWIHYLLDDAAKAVPLLERARAAMPNSPEVRYRLGMAYFRCNDRQRAASELQAALALSDSFDQADDARAALKQMNGA